MTLVETDSLTPNPMETHAMKLPAHTCADVNARGGHELCSNWVFCIYFTWL